jgi:hypothetical protein
MDHDLKYLIGKFMDEYQDDLTIHFNLIEECINHLSEVFAHCVWYGISLKPKKFVFVVS